jgi:hypothetical protein
MLPVRANANTVIENKPSDATEVPCLYNREQYGVNPYFMVLNTQKLLQVLMKKHLDKAPNYEREQKQENTS